MHVRLNGWKRIGIVLSAIWAIGGGMWGLNISGHQIDWLKENLDQEVRINDQEQDNCRANASTILDRCTASADKDMTLCGQPTNDPDCSIASNASNLCGEKHTQAAQACTDQYSARETEFIANNVRPTMENMAMNPYYEAIFGLVPIPLAWLIVYAFIGLWRWIRRGFNTSWLLFQDGNFPKTDRHTGAGASMAGNDITKPFPPVSEAEWRTLVERVLGGRPFERLISTTFEGLKVGPLNPCPAPEAFCEPSELL